MIERFSFCTNCMGRRAHLERTLPHNLAVLEQFPEAELVLLDYNSADGLAEWVLSEFQPQICSGRLRFYRTADPGSYVMTHAKNAAYLLAGGDVVTNLDGDNFLTAPYVRFVLNVFRFGTKGGFIAFNGPGIGSRISVHKNAFLDAGGYDEDLGVGWGPDDFDLVFRLFHNGMRRISSVNTRLFGEAIEHPDEGRNELTPKKLSKRESHRVNLTRIVENGKAGRHIANQGRRWGEISVCGRDNLQFSVFGMNGRRYVSGVPSSEQLQERLRRDIGLREHG